MTEPDKPLGRRGAMAALGAACEITLQGLLSIVLLPFLIVSVALIVIWVGLPMLAGTLSLLRSLSGW